jgi:CBS domain-containing protein
MSFMSFSPGELDAEGTALPHKEITMATARDILASKGSFIHTISAGATGLQATQYMNEHKIGALVVMDEGRVVGMFTERDVLRRIVAPERSPRQTAVADVMTQDVICCEPDTDLEEASAIMTSRRIRHLPVCDTDGKLIGLVSIGDLNAFHSSTQEQTIHFLSDYIYGRV